MEGAKGVADTLCYTDVVLVLDVTGFDTTKDFVIEKCPHPVMRQFVSDALGQDFSYTIIPGCSDPISDEDETDVYRDVTQLCCFVGIPCAGGDYNDGPVRIRQRSLDAVVQALGRISQHFASSFRSTYLTPALDSGVLKPNPVSKLFISVRSHDAPGLSPSMAEATSLRNVPKGGQGRSKAQNKGKGKDKGRGKDGTATSRWTSARIVGAGVGAGVEGGASAEGARGLAEGPGASVWRLAPVHAVMKAYFSGQMTSETSRVELTYGTQDDIVEGARRVSEEITHKDCVLLLQPCIQDSPSSTTTVLLASSDHVLRLLSNSNIFHLPATNPIKAPYPQSVTLWGEAERAEVQAYLDITQHVCVLGLPVRPGDDKGSFVTCLEDIQAATDAILKFVTAHRAVAWEA
uniref:Uncharacterized protein n=1 Tax=Cyanoptyche gloeocystis TaxID=77922 RepID=A0A7S2NMZ7_9EUKA